MKIFFEDWHYKKEAIPSLEGIAPIELQGEMVKLPYVGYYSDSKHNAIFILPKVFISDGLGFGRYQPEQLIDTQAQNSPLTHEDRSFIFGLSAWLYQAIALFNEHHPSNEISSSRSLAGLVEHRGEGDATLLDHILSLLRFYKAHQNLFTYIAIIRHSGNNKIHWAKTIRQTQPLLHNGTPLYLNCKTKNKAVNYDEELITLFFSTLEYLAHTYHFSFKKSLNYDTLKPHRIAHMMQAGRGTRRLRKIRGKYFTDELVALWKLLYAFYEKAERVAQKGEYSERLLVRNFNMVFEDMIDALIGEQQLPKGLKEQKDGKIIDHIYKDKSLLDASDIYFIADSKYYKEDNTISGASLYKQFTYAKNVIQYNIDIFNGGDIKALHYRDKLTEGYNPTPSFFVRGKVAPNDLSYSEYKLERQGGVQCSYHFRNRLFDRDTLLALTYEINFLYVLCAYVQTHGESNAISTLLRGRFRQDIIAAFEDEYDFYRLIPTNSSLEDFVEKYFRKLIGKIYCTKDEGDEQGKQLILALKKANGQREDQNKELEEENKKLLEDISQDAQIGDPISLAYITQHKQST